MSRLLVDVVDHTGWVRDRRAVKSVVEAVLRAEKVWGKVAVAFVNMREMADLNERYRAAEGPTDVLSFPQVKRGDWLDEADELGEVVVCPELVLEYSREESTTFEAQLAWTLVHGVLHLLGYDHETDKGEMREREAEIVAGLGETTAALTLNERGRRALDQG